MLKYAISYKQFTNDEEENEENRVQVVNSSATRTDQDEEKGKNCLSLRSTKINDLIFFLLFLILLSGIVAALYTTSKGRK